MFKDIDKKINPFFEKYSIQKLLDFKDFCKVANLINKKAHLTTFFVNQIRIIKECMNSGRV